MLSGLNIIGKKSTFNKSTIQNILLIMLKLPRLKKGTKFWKLKIGHLNLMISTELIRDEFDRSFQREYTE